MVPKAFIIADSIDFSYHALELLLSDDLQKFELLPRVVCLLEGYRITRDCGLISLFQCFPRLQLRMGAGVARSVLLSLGMSILDFVQF